MQIIFGHVGYWQVPLIRLLKFFKFKVFYLHIELGSKFQRSETASQLKKKNITPLLLEFEKEINRKSFSLMVEDSDEYAYKKSIKMIPDKILKKYHSLFSIDEKEVKKLRLLIQDVISGQRSISGTIEIWSNLHPSEKIILISFRFKDFFIFSVADNITRIIIPTDILSYFGKITKRFFSLLLKSKNKKKNDQNLDENCLRDAEKKNIAFVVHKRLSYGRLFDKSLYYSDDKNSPLNKYNILHLDYSNFSIPDKNIHYVCLRKIAVNKVEIFFKTLQSCIKTFSLIRSWSTFIVWLFFIQQYISYIKYCEVIKKFKALKIALIDFDYLCPKTLLLAFKKNNIKTFATQERFITTFHSYANVMVDTYYTASEFTANLIKRSKYYDIKNVVPMGQYRSDYIPLYKNKNVPEEISKEKNNGKKILIILGHHSPDYWFESYNEPLLNWTDQLGFLEECIRLSQGLSNTYIILRYKTLSWLTNKFFKNILDKINNCENITISTNYKESAYSYKLCANADLVIAKHTSLADECLANEIPVLFHEYTHNMKKIFLVFPNYLPSELICYNFDELYQKSKSFLFSSSNKLKDEIKKLNQTIYLVSEKKNIKNKILENLENQLIKNG
jgi:hypothetical protein